MMAPMTLFDINPSLWLFLDSTGDEGATDAVVVATLAEKKQGKKALGGVQTLKILNYFGSTGRWNPPRAAKLDGRVSKLWTPRKRPEKGAPCKKAQGREA
jgi:hypothetical protein